MADFNISATTGQWLTSGYSLTMAIIMPLTAFQINRFPIKWLYCTALMIFLAGLLLNAAAVNFPMMMGAGHSGAGRRNDLDYGIGDHSFHLPAEKKEAPWACMA